MGRGLAGARGGRTDVRKKSRNKRVTADGGPLLPSSGPAAQVPGARRPAPSPTLSPTDPVPCGLLTLCPGASSGP